MTRICFFFNYSIAFYRTTDYTGCPDQIGRNLKLTLLRNQKTCRKYKDSFRIVGNRAIKYVLGYYDLGTSLDPLKWALVQHGGFQMRRNKVIT